MEIRNPIIELSGFNPTQAHFINERLTFLIYSNLLERVHNAIDVGANHGLHTLPLSRACEAGHIYAFEPNRALLPKLYSLVADRNVQIFPYAVSDSLELANFYVPAGLDGWASLEDRRSILPDRAFEITTVPCVPLDSLSEIKSKPIHFIKIDVEGRELSALNGMKEIIEHSKPAVIFEKVRTSINLFFHEREYFLYDMCLFPLDTGLVESGAYDKIPNILALPKDSASRIVSDLKSKVPFQDVLNYVENASDFLPSPVF
jgi:FkbM family methyltransferase